MRWEKSREQNTSMCQQKLCCNDGSRMIACRLKEQELQQAQRSWCASSQQEGSNSGEAERSRLQVKALEGQLRDLHSRLTRLQADTRFASSHCCPCLCS